MNYKSINNNVDGKIALFLDGHRITGYTTVGGYDADDVNTVVVQDDILPEGFFNTEDIEKYLYYDDPEEVVEDYEYHRNEDTTEPEPYVTEESSNDVVEIKEELAEIKAMLAQLLGQKG